MIKATNIIDPDFTNQGEEVLWEMISPNYVIDESLWLTELLKLAEPTDQEESLITSRATRLIEQLRARDDAVHIIDLFLLEYSLDTREGILLMCLAEALIRIPDTDTANALIKDKLSVADWKSYLRQSDSLLVNASTWGLMLTGKIVTMDSKEDGSPSGIINRLITKMGEPVIRKAIHQAMTIMGKHFVLGRTIDEALKNSKKPREEGFTYSFDMLGEAALTADDAIKYQNSYKTAIEAMGVHQNSIGRRGSLSTISIKMSALHPRYETSQELRVLKEMTESVLKLIQAAQEQGVGITIDAEEQDRLELSLKLFKRLYSDPICKGWGNLGLVVQAYGKRALPVLCWLAALRKEHGDEIPVRLVKGAYWDSEIKRCQQLGLSEYPVYTRKESTDVAYIACAKFLLSDNIKGSLLPQFASHNAHTVASILAISEHREFEFQCLHGMGGALYNTVMEQESVPVRIYAPVGSHQNLLPYLVRRLLENGANSSFVHRLIDSKTPIANLVRHPVTILKQHALLANNRIPLPEDIFGESRKNSSGININIDSQWLPFKRAVEPFLIRQWRQGPVINGQVIKSAVGADVVCPYMTHESVGHISWSSETDIEQALTIASAAFNQWNKTDVGMRAECLKKLADLLEKNRAELVALCHREAGKTINDSIDEIREAVDFCRYYAVQALKLLGTITMLPGVTGESNELYLSGRGVFLCISPWNFPLAIYLGQIVAALVSGNTVIAKPAEQTSLIAGKAIEYMLEAGFPSGVIQMLPGDGASIGEHLLMDHRIAGVVFTGSTETAHIINRSLANRSGAIVPLIAETGGQNTMIIDSSALPEQVVGDVVRSAFSSAGQRCSALRVLYVQDDVADRIITLLKGAMAELKVGDPTLYDTDLGPVIDKQAKTSLQRHIDKMKKEFTMLAQTPLPASASMGFYVAPTAFEISNINQLESENFGPILHVIRYKSSELNKVIKQINTTGYGLTLGIHTRNEMMANYIEENVWAGNTYINRDQIGAVVGAQPFGGIGLSGTGPKAGGPYYLLRFLTERTKTINITASGGNHELLSLI
ncbi:MAG: bifunctional proline dehydrogenase/L-glutamate gamma-semialdehyde dehydrogenase PutA [Candidatus Endonucleobacter bathymodioli]|uniref:Bifunctional protein PutA n=1 Tax=Candidatus Endonucleibacter bathymodioli TaxID=539814 RepID=A0AA90SLS5_9GAMM|nr:bifunctional proline dehydrogenase/L-glutamate gamma-semialdehyde dehydrogenase PutA [Candidatus Endonucleobacter bathymodioli]